MEPTVIYSDRLRQYLKKILRRTALLHLGSGLISFSAAAAWILVGLILWTAIGDAPAIGTVSVVSRFVVTLLSILFVYFLIWPLVRMPRLKDLAAEVERRKDLDELVRAGFEFSNDEGASQRYSPELVKEVIRRAIDKVEGLQVRFLFLNKQDLALLPVAYGGLAVLLILSLFNPAMMMNASQRVVDPAAAAASDHSANIQVAPGDITVLAGADVRVAGLDFGLTEEEVLVSYNLAQDFWKSEETDRVAGATDDATARTFDSYEYEFVDLRHSISYYFSAGDHKSRVYTITVVNEPILTDLTLKLTPPSYTGEAELILEDNGGNVQALEGTRVEVVGQSNNQLTSAWVKFNEGKRTPIDVTGKEVEFDFRALRDGHYSVILEDDRGYKTNDPLVYSVEVFQDHAPALDVIEPGGDSSLPRNRQLDVGFIASDDYGVQSAAIYHRKNGEAQFRRVGISIGNQKGSKEVAQAYRWDLSDFSLFPGNYIEYFVQVTDNNVVTGPGVAKSRVYQISVPTMAELYSQIEDEGARRDTALEETIKDSQEFQEKLEKITREFIKTEKMEWTQKKEMDNALAKQKQIEDSLEDIKQSLDETLQNLADNEMTSKEIGEKMEEIRDLLDDIDSDELRKHMEELRKSVEKLDPNEIRKALENLNLDTEKMLEQLERTAQLLKQIQKEQKMEELVRKSKDLMDQQEALNQETAEADEGDKQSMDELSEKQDQLSKKADDLQKSAEELSKEMMGEEQKTSEELGEMSEQMKKDGPKENMDQASDELQQQNKQQAQQQQQEAMDKMISLFQKASKAQQQMQQQQGQKMAANFQKYAKQALELSFKQEALVERLQAQRRGEESEDMKRLAQDQMSYKKATEAIANEIMKLAGKSTNVSEELMQALGAAITRMQNSVLFLEQNKPFMSTAHAHNAIESLNTATIEMLSSAKQCSAGSPQSGSESMAQQMMQQLIPQQQDVMSQTKEMMQMQMMQEAMRQQQQAQLDRLAGQQRSLREVAEKIEKEMKGDKNSMGSLERMIEEMEAVAKAIKRGEINQDLINKEQRILSRLLDADRSINTRDYEKKRESVTADDVFSRSLGLKAKDPMSQSLREEIRRAMQLKAPGEFEDLIKLYFRALAEESAAGSKAN